MLIQSIVGVICGGLALLLLIYCIFMLCEKGPIFTNRFIWSSEAEKKTFDKKAEYRLASIVYGTLALFFALETIYVFTLDMRILIVGFSFIGLHFIYLIINAVKSQRKL